MFISGDLSLLSPQYKRVSLALGMFDGVHLGHQKVLTALEGMAQRNKSIPVVFSFTPHPKEFLTGQAPLRLLGLPLWCEVLNTMGVRAVVLQTFNAELAQLSPLDFLNRYFRRQDMRVCGICVGQAFRFGAGNAGTSQDIQKWCRDRGMDYHIEPEATYKDEVISSSRIRAAIQGGCLSEAETMLGRSYIVSGKVVHGQGVGGKELGFPTANLQVENYLLPPPGVYAAMASPEIAPLLQGIVYVGDAPTIRTNGKVVLEFHAFDFDGDLYGQKMDVSFNAFIRGSSRFSSRQALVAQIRQDIQVARKVLSAW